MIRPMLSTLLPILVAGQSALAVPTLYPKDLNLLSSIQNTTNSNLVGDTKDVRTVYVMPPNEGYGRVAGLHTLTANLLFCRNMKSLADQTLEIETKVKQLRLEQGDERKNLAEVDKKITAAKLDAANYATEKHLGELATIDANINTMTIALNANIASLDTCKTGCDELVAQNTNLQNQLTQLMTARTKFYTKNIEAARVYDQKKQVVDAHVAEKTSILENYSIIETKLTEANARILSLFSTYGSLEGGRAALNYRSDWNNNISKLREQNPGLNFAPINTENAKVYPAFVGVAGVPGTGSILGFETPGSTGIKDGAISFPSYPSAIDGNVVLSLVGACPMAYPELFKFAQSTSPKNMNYGMMVTYEFPSSMMLKLKATYNMHKFYQLVQSSGSSGGLFSSHSWSNSEERAVFHDAFSVEWTEEDPGNALTDDQRMAMERDVRTQIMSRLVNIAVPQTPDAGKLLAASAQPVHGAVVIADSLMQAAPANPYFIAGAAVFRVLDAIFGSGSSSSSMTKIEDRDLTEEWTRDKVVMKPWITSYKMDPISTPVANN